MDSSNFWEYVSKNIENMLNTTIKINNKDLLVDIPEDSHLPLYATPSPIKLNSKSSCLYTKYSDKHKILMKSLKSRTSRHRNRSFEYKNPNKNILTPSNPSEIISRQRDFKKSHRLEIKGYQANLGLPQIKIKPVSTTNSYSKIKEAIKKTQLKYSKIYTKLKNSDGTIKKDTIMDYIKQNDANSSKKLRNFFQFPDNTKLSNHIRLPNLIDILEYSSDTLNKGNLVMVTYS
jgi:hypothetical protein